jgi:hypothetical protein
MAQLLAPKGITNFSLGGVLPSRLLHKRDHNQNLSSRQDAEIAKENQIAEETPVNH